MPLRIHIDRTYREGTSGPGTFMARLCKCLEEEYGVNFTSKKPHLSLGVIFLPKVRGSKNVVRVDGCYYNELNSGVGLNKTIKKSINRADGVIFQSGFSKKMCELLLSVKARKSSIIYNGVDQKWVDSIEPKIFPDKYVFVACASWRNSKRPKSIIKSFISANITNSRLIVIGKFNKQISHPQVNYVGNKKPEDVISYMKGATAFIHLCKIESCPNVVIEALSCHLPIICNNIGGTPEIVGSDGIIVNCDQPFSFKTIKEKNLDNIDVQLVSKALKNVINKQWNISRPDLDIRISAQKYLDFFLSVSK